MQEDPWRHFGLRALIPQAHDSFAVALIPRARRGARGALYPKSSSCGAELPARGLSTVGSAPDTW